jgi:hypothetical protein
MNESIKIGEQIPDELNIEKIEREFVELPPDKVELLAVNLARTEGFTRSLIIGKVLTSQELADKMGSQFVKSHRGYYMSHPPRQTYHGLNSNISFNLGREQNLYAKPTMEWNEETDKFERDDFGGPYGSVYIGKDLLKNLNVTPSWGANLVGQRKSNEFKKLAEKYPQFKKFEKFNQMNSEERFDYDCKPPKEDFYDYVQFMRMLGKLHGSDQCEINYNKSESDEFPKVDLEDGIILIPNIEREEFLDQIQAELELILPVADKIKESFGVDISGLEAEAVIGRFESIYWYPQDDIAHAVQYLTTHPEVIREIRGE